MSGFARAAAAVLLCQGCYFWYGWGRLPDACRNGDPIACRVAAGHDTFEAFPVITTEADRHRYHVLAGQAYEKECNREHKTMVCYEAALEYFQWGSLESDVPHALELARASCDQGHREACLLLGFGYQYGYGTAENREAAKGAFHKACKATYGYSSLRCCDWERCIGEIAPQADACKPSFGIRRGLDCCDWKNCIGHVTPHRWQKPTDEQRLAAARDLAARGQFVAANDILRSLSAPAIGEPVRGQARALMEDTSVRAGREKIAAARKLREGGNGAGALEALRPLEGTDWPEVVRGEARALRESVAEDLWSASVKPLLARSHPLPAAVAAQAIVALLPADHALAARTAALREQGAAAHLALAQRHEAARRPAAAALHRRIAALLGGPAAGRGREDLELELVRLAPDLDLGPDCAWLRARLDAMPELRGGTRFAFAGTVKCERDESHRRWDEAISYAVRRRERRTRTVTEPVTRIETYSCKQVNYCTGPRCMTSYTDATCSREVKSTREVTRTEWEWVDEPRSGMRSHDVRKLVARVEGSLRPAWPGASAVVISHAERLEEEALTSPLDSQAFSGKSLADLDLAASEKVASQLRATLAPMLAQRARDARAALDSAPSGDESAEEAALVALLRSPESGGGLSPWMRERWGMDAAQVLGVLEGRPPAP